MAIWQFSIILLPREWAVDVKYDSSSLYEPDGFETAFTWKDRQLAPNFREQFSKILPPSDSWSDAILCWGDEKANDIQVGLENSAVTDIQIRLALHTDFRVLLNPIIEVTEELNCVFFFPELHLISNATEAALMAALGSSRAARFVKNPSKYLEGLEHKA